MKKLFIFITVAAFSITAFGSCKGVIGAKANLKTEQDTVTYAMGVLNFGRMIEQLKADSTMSYDVFIATFSEVVAGKATITPDSAQKFLQNYFTVRLPEKNKAAEAEFLTQAEKDNKSAVKTESGILYEILREGDNNVKAVNDQDMVKVLYEGKLKNGTVFDSSYERGDTAEFALNQVIKGWSEGMKLVGKGGKIKLWIPSELGYGPQGNAQYGGPIGPYEPLVFEVELIDVVPAPAAK